MGVSIRGGAWLTRLLAAGLTVIAGACANTSGPPDVGPDSGMGNGEVTVRFEPARIVYVPGQQVTPQATVLDSEGNPVPDAPIMWFVEPMGAATNSGGTWTLQQEGELTFTACAQVDGVQVCGEGSIRVDANPPSLEITSPLPGEEIDGAARPTITVEGTLSDTNEESDLRVFVNGSQVTLDAGGGFSTEITPQFGINHITVEASDQISALAVEELDVLWAPGYLVPNADSTQFDLSDALMLRIGQRFFDDAQALDLTAADGMGNVTAEDLADILRLVLAHADLKSLITNPVVDTSEISLHIDDISIGQVIVDIDVSDPASGDAGLLLFIELRDVVVTTSGDANLLGEMKSLAGTITTDLVAQGELVLSRPSPSDPYQATLASFDTYIGYIDAVFDDPELTTLFDVVTSSLRTTVEDLIQGDPTAGGGLIGEFTDILPSLLGDLLLEIEGALSDLSFTLDTGLGDPITVNLNANIATIDVATGSTGHITARFDASMGTPNVPIHPESMGAPQADADPMPSFTTFGPLQLAVKQDLVNGLLHSLWNSGLLDLTVEVGGFSADVAAKLPPVVRDAPLGTTCQIDGAPCDVILQLGQLEVTAAGQTFGIHAEAGARITVANGEVALAIQSTPDLQVWEVSDSDGLLTPELVRELVLNSVWPMLFESLGSSLTFPLPLPNLADLGLDSLAPALAGAELTLTMDRRLDVETGYLGLVVDLSLTGPAP